MLDFHFKAPCKTTMHKRKCEDLFDLRRGEISTVLTTETPGLNRLQANCWIKDVEGRKQGIILSHDFIMGLVESVEQLRKRGEIIPKGEAELES